MSKHVRVAIIGSGFSGLGLAIKLKQKGMRDFLVFERASELGGTWRDNTYPGCQCDVPSHLYSFSFAMNPDWSRTYSTQPEIQAYLRDCALRFGVMPYIRFQHEVEQARWDDDEELWRLRTSQGEWTADVVVSANGPLSEPATPSIEGLDEFEGVTFHSGSWDASSELDGRKVAVVGTGASAIQIVPKIQPHVESLYVFQRTPAWVLPHTDRPVSNVERSIYRRAPVVQRAIRGGIYASRELVALGMAKDPRLLAPIRRLATRHLHHQVRDPELRRKLTPKYSPGCKRLLLSNTYYPALTRANVDVVTDPIARIGPSWIETADGRRHEVDTIVFATGFHITDNPVFERLRGRGGRTLRETWEPNGMRAYVGTTVPGFPNFFVLAGPNTGQGHTSLLYMIESQFNYILNALDFMQRDGIATVEVRDDVAETFTAHVQEKMKRTVWSLGGCVSWYMDDKGNNPAIWPDFTWRYRKATRRFDPDAYVVVKRDDPREREPHTAEAATA